MDIKHLPRVAAAVIITALLIFGCSQSAALQDGEFELDCSSADSGTRCNPISGSLGCIGSSSATGCVASTNSCTTCYFGLSQGESAASAKGDIVAAMLGLVISNPGRWSEHGVAKGDTVIKIDGNGIGDGLDLSKIEEMRKSKDVTLTVLRHGPDGYAVIKITIPQL